MELVLAVVAGVLYATGLYLMLRRRLGQLIIGAAMATGPFADPVPQSLILTAIVIGFGVLAFSLVLAHRVHHSAASDDIDAIAPDRD
jgi:multicomponent Na+:H+ antiporter subunit C